MGVHRARPGRALRGIETLPVISALIMGSPVRRLLNPITRCRDQPVTAMQGQTTDEAPAKLDAKRLTLMSECS
jgi:hypothetical protein